MRAQLDGSEARWVVLARARRSTALALHAPAARLFVLDAYYGALHSAALDGADRATHLLFRHDASPPPPAPHLSPDKGTRDHDHSNHYTATDIY